MTPPLAQLGGSPVTCHRRLQVRDGRRADILLGFVQPACALVCFKQLER
jgi:hypothetical protein